MTGSVPRLAFAVAGGVILASLAAAVIPAVFWPLILVGGLVWCLSD
jgi:hypothetical protein